MSGKFVENDDSMEGYPKNKRQAHALFIKRHTGVFKIMYPFLTCHQIKQKAEGKWLKEMEHKFPKSRTQKKETIPKERSNFTPLKIAVVKEPSGILKRDSEIPDKSRRVSFRKDDEICYRTPSEEDTSKSGNIFISNYDTEAGNKQNHSEQQPCSWSYKKTVCYSKSERVFKSLKNNYDFGSPISPSPQDKINIKKSIPNIRSKNATKSKLNCHSEISTKQDGDDDFQRKVKGKPKNNPSRHKRLCINKSQSGLKNETNFKTSRKCQRLKPRSWKPVSKDSSSDSDSSPIFITRKSLEMTSPVLHDDNSLDSIVPPSQSESNSKLNIYTEGTSNPNTPVATDTVKNNNSKNRENVNDLAQVAVDGCLNTDHHEAILETNERHCDLPEPHKNGNFPAVENKDKYMNKGLFGKFQESSIDTSQMDSILSKFATSLDSIQKRSSNNIKEKRMTAKSPPSKCRSKQSPNNVVVIDLDEIDEEELPKIEYDNSTLQISSHKSESQTNISDESEIEIMDASSCSNYGKVTKMLDLASANTETYYDTKISEFYLNDDSSVSSVNTTKSIMVNCLENVKEKKHQSSNIDLNHDSDCNSESERNIADVTTKFKVKKKKTLKDFYNQKATNSKVKSHLPKREWTQTSTLASAKNSDIVNKYILAMRECTEPFYSMKGNQNGLSPAAPAIHKAFKIEKRSKTKDGNFESKALIKLEAQKYGNTIRGQCNTETVTTFSTTGRNIPLLNWEIMKVSQPITYYEKIWDSVIGHHKSEFPHFKKSICENTASKSKTTTDVITEKWDKLISVATNEFTDTKLDQTSKNFKKSNFSARRRDGVNKHKLNFEQCRLTKNEKYPLDGSKPQKFVHKKVYRSETPKKLKKKTKNIYITSDEDSLTSEVSSDDSACKTQGKKFSKSKITDSKEKNKENIPSKSFKKNIIDINENFWKMKLRSIKENTSNYNKKAHGKELPSYRKCDSVVSKHEKARKSDNPSHQCNNSRNKSASFNKKWSDDSLIDDQDCIEKKNKVKTKTSKEAYKRNLFHSDDDDSKESFQTVPEISLRKAPTSPYANNNTSSKKYQPSTERRTGGSFSTPPNHKQPNKNLSPFSAIHQRYARKKKMLDDENMNSLSDQCGNSGTCNNAKEASDAKVAGSGPLCEVFNTPSVEELRRATRLSKNFKSFCIL